MTLFDSSLMLVPPASRRNSVFFNAYIRQIQRLSPARVTENRGLAYIVRRHSTGATAKGPQPIKGKFLAALKVVGNRSNQWFLNLICQKRCQLGKPSNS